MSISLVGVPRTPIAGANEPPAFRGEPAPAAQASAAPGQSVAAPNSAADQGPRSEVDVLREAAAAAAAERKAKAAERAARVRERERELSQREERIKQVEGRLRAYQQPGGAALALRDLEDAGIGFEQLAQVVANGGVATPEQEIAAMRAELEDLRSGLTDAEQRRAQRDATEQTQAQRAAEANAQDDYLRDLAGAAQQDPERFGLVLHFGDRAVPYLWQTSEAIFEQTGRVPEPAEVLEAVQQDLEREIEGASAARARLGPARAAPGQPGAGRTGEAERRARFLGQLDQILRRVR